MFFSGHNHLPIDASDMLDEDDLASQASWEGSTTASHTHSSPLSSHDVAEVHDMVEMPQVVVDVLLATLTKYVDIHCQFDNALENLGVASQACKPPVPEP